MERVIRWLVRILTDLLPPKCVNDVRAFGPFTECPVCQCNVMETEIILDPETLLPALWILDVTCACCGALYKSACPVDELVPDDQA